MFLLSADPNITDLLQREHPEILFDCLSPYIISTSTLTSLTKLYPSSNLRPSLPPYLVIITQII